MKLRGLITTIPESFEFHGAKSMSSYFSQKVFKIVSQIPKGKTLTYKLVAEQAGKPRAYRAVGNVLNKNSNPKIFCHRVIRSDGNVGGYNKGAGLKKQILKSEGIVVK